MIEKTVLDYLTQTLSVPCYMAVPETNPNPDAQTFVVIEKTGSSKTNHICRATFAIQSYADTLFKAATLNESVKDAMENIITLDTVTRCELQGDYPYTRISTKQPRYQAVFELTHY